MIEHHRPGGRAAQRAIAAGGGLVSGMALIAAVSTGPGYAAASANPDQLNSTMCDYAGGDTAGLGLTAEQTGNAEVIVEAAADLDLPRRAAEIALATAFQESRFDNGAVSASGRSFGLFQQTPAAGWGTREQVTTPSRAARSFYQRLVRVPRWQSMPLTKAAALVQRPRTDLRGRYAKHETLAKQLVAALWDERDLDDLDLTDREKARIQERLKTAAGLGLSREKVVSALAGDLREEDDAEDSETILDQDEDSDTARDEAEDIVGDIAAGLCDERDDDERDDARDDDVRDDDMRSGTMRDDNMRSGNMRDGDMRGGSGTPLTATGAGGNTAVSAALTQRGIPYSWGGGGPAGPSYGIGRGADIKGFDCSGLTEYAWSKAGVRIGGTTYEQVNKGRKVARSEVRPGDLVFYDTDPTRPGPDHVGLAINNTQMVNAPSTGAVVRVDSIDRRSYLTAVRPSR
ncbi:NlpC/P60 family protein [Nonomuraea sp. PA05]|uniref:C40 family peptidase n=1 Tax=Nonomuraea sp. PA05 TaxID=2604466 RepID=UPI0011DA32B2|nr:NlpC/P60 family protein [Nonomuraea sp. PA05]TYB57039.1 NlpC/P60 family protein [Nonomuraea sp. PA05]